MSFLVKFVSKVRSKIEKCEFLEKLYFKNLTNCTRFWLFFSFFKVYIQGPGLSMVGVLKAPIFGYVPELLKKHCQ